MTTDTAIEDSGLLLGEGWRDRIEAGVRGRIRGFIEEMLEAELRHALGRERYVRLKTTSGGAVARSEGLGDEEAARGVSVVPAKGHRHGNRERELMGTFGTVTIAVPRARLDTADGKTTEWQNKTLPAYRRRTKEIEALIAGSYLAGCNTRRVGRALAALFRGAVSKDTVSRVWRKIKADWDSWNKRDLANEDVVRLILDGTVVRVRLDRKATSISLLVVLGIRRDGQKVLLAVKNMGGESEAAWRTLLDDLAKRGLKKPELAIVDGAPGLEKALVALWSDLPIQRCTVHKLRNLVAHAPKKLADEIAADYSDMIYAKTAKEVEARRKRASRRRAIGSSLSRGYRPSSGRARAPPMPSSGCTRSSSGGSRRRPCCRRRRPLPCCSGRCSPPVRSRSEKSTAGRRSMSTSLSPLTSPPDPLR
jgi:putative transposase